MKRYQAQLKLNIRGPFLSKSLDAAALGTDASCRRRGDQWVLPGTQLRGHLRESLTLFAQRAPTANLYPLIAAWFGKGTKADTRLEPERGALIFSHEFHALVAPNPTLYRVAIDDDTGVAAHAALLVLESAGLPGATLTFTGAIDAYFSCESDVKTCQHWLRKALAWIDAMGALKGIGFGTLESATLANFKAFSESINAQDTETASHKTLSFQLDRPFCFNEREVRSNTFSSKPFVPGAAVLGALFRYCHATTLDSNCELILEHREKIGCTHALPLKTEQHERPLSFPPLSTVVTDVTPCTDPPTVSGVHDVRACAAATLIGGAVPWFQADWKGRHLKAVAAALDLPAELNRELIVRTGIKDGRAEDDKLFALECLNPGTHAFDCTLSISGGVGTVLLWQALAAVLPQALCGLGKTDAIATHLQLRAKTIAAVPAAEMVFVTLQSDAAIDIDVTTLHSTGDGDKLFLFYRDWFHAKSDGGLALSHFFASQRYAGGTYLHKRFGGGAYRATLLTQAGSVFAFEVLDQEKAAATLKAWADFGLPGENNWKSNPYRRENGYGEVRIDSGPLGEIRNLLVGSLS
jgi:hypothetical protein